MKALEKGTGSMAGQHIEELRQRLAPLIHRESETFARVLHVEAAGKRWLFASNGKAFLAVEADVEPSTDVKFGEYIAGLIGQAVGADAFTQWEPLRDFMRCEPEIVLAPKMKECETCSGTGECDCPCCGADHDCGDCSGNGEVRAGGTVEVVKQRQEPISFGPVTIDRALFHQYAAGLTAERARYSHGGELDAVLFADEGCSWVLGVMPIRAAAVASYQLAP
jgi:hypothetical protein